MVMVAPLFGHPCKKNSVKPRHIGTPNSFGQHHKRRHTHSQTHSLHLETYPEIPRFLLRPCQHGGRATSPALPHFKRVAWALYSVTLCALPCTPSVWEGGGVFVQHYPTGNFKGVFACKAHLISPECSQTGETLTVISCPLGMCCDRTGTRAFLIAWLF